MECLLFLVNEDFEQVPFFNEKITLAYFACIPILAINRTKEF
jgi:hypothetical protein